MPEIFFIIPQTLMHFFEMWSNYIYEEKIFTLLGIRMLQKSQVKMQHS